jgi:VIT1/CCC1 family predicted Fe2+/Mn2+ transporter
VSFSLKDTAYYYGFFLIPWVTLILGWTYVVNDEKISSIGRYFRKNLATQISSELAGRTSEELFGWEGVGRDDTHRIRRKIEQLIINELTFVVSGIGGLIAFYFLVQPTSILIISLCCLVLLFLIVLFVEIIIYADITKGR